MKIKSDILRVRPALAADGSKLEAEQQPVERVQTTDFAASMQDGRSVGTMRGEIVTQVSAGELATAMRHPCMSCKHWNEHAWQKLKLRWEDPATPISERNQLNAIRAAFLSTGNAQIADTHAGEDNDLDVEHALNVLGICEPLTEMEKLPIITYPTAGCPEEVKGPQQPLGFYKAKNKDNERMGSKVFDNVMKLATGEKL